MVMPSIDGCRLLRRIEELGRIGCDGDGGVTRLAFSTGDLEARRQLIEWMHVDGLEVAVDPAANILGTVPSSSTSGRPAIVLGSHIDTVTSGGRLDGAYGVLASLEVAAALRASGWHLAHDLRVVSFTDEEGTTSPTPMWGSRAVVGAAGRGDDAHSARLAAAGGDASRLSAAEWPAGSVKAFVELHVEQGPRLDDAGIDLGIVESVCGRVEIDIEVTGTQQHAGTTPMNARADAVTAASRIILAVRELAAGLGLTTSTVGAMYVTPNLRNVISGRVELKAELRANDAELLQRAVEVLERRALEVERDEGVGIAVHLRTTILPTRLDHDVANAAQVATKRIGASTMRLSSMAGHDAQIVADRFPAGVLFVPSIGGISHARSEQTSPHHLVLGAAALLETVLEIDHE